MNRNLSLGLVAALAMLATPVSFAHGDSSHAPMAHAYSPSEVVETGFGRQGDPRKVTRTFTVDMIDNMRFTPDVLKVQRGETVRLNVVNKGRVLHELVLGTPADIREHWRGGHGRKGGGRVSSRHTHPASVTGLDEAAR